MYASSAFTSDKTACISKVSRLKKSSSPLSRAEKNCRLRACTRKARGHGDLPRDRNRRSMGAGEVMSSRPHGRTVQRNAEAWALCPSINAIDFGRLEAGRAPG